MTDTLIQVTPQVWVFPHDPDPARIQPNVGIVVAGKHTVLIDGGNSPRHARRVMIALDDIDAPPVSHVIYTHYHWDHVFGAMVFGATAVAHELCRKHLSEMAVKPWSNSYIQEEIQRSPNREHILRAMSRAVEDWRNFRIVQPEIVFSHSLNLYMAGLTFELEHVGGAHSPDSIIIRVPEARVLFTGDSHYPPPPHSRKPGDTFDAALIERFASDERVDWVITGHDAPRSRAEFAATNKRPERNGA